MENAYEYGKWERENLTPIKWSELAEWLELETFKGVWYRRDKLSGFVKLTRASRLRVSELAKYEWFLEER